MNEKIHCPVSDLGSSAYLLMHGHRVLGRKDRDIMFEVDPKKRQDFEERKVEYLRSQYHYFDSCLMSLKKMSEYVPDNPNLQRVGDLGAGAFLLMHGFKLVGRQGKEIIFEADPSDASEFKSRQLEYLSSEFHQFDSCIMSLKKVGFYN